MHPQTIEKDGRPEILAARLQFSEVQRILSTGSSSWEQELAEFPSNSPPPKKNHEYTYNLP